MEMTLRWYGSKFDTVTLKQIRQIPGVTGVITTLYDTEPGEVWSRERIRALKDEVEAAGLKIAGIESVNVHEAIKTGAADRDMYIDNYIKCLENLGEEDIHLVCYNFMPVFDWTRTELARMRKDGSTVLAYNQKTVDSIDPAKMFDSISNDMNGTVMPGWEPERMAKVKQLFEEYAAKHHIFVQTVWEANSPRALLNAVLYDRVLAVMSLRLMPHEIRHGKIRVFYNQNGEWNRKFKLVYHKNKFLSPAIHELERLLHTYENIELSPDMGILE